MYEDYDALIENAGILEDSNKSLDDIQKEIAALFENEEDVELKKLSIWDRELFICCEISLERRDEGQQFLFPQSVFTNGKCIPDIDNFEKERFEFYNHRLENIGNIIVKVRYANYCFQYCKKKDKYKYSLQICQLLCEYLKEESIGYKYVVYFSRLFELSLSYSHSEIIQKLDILVNGIFSRENTEEQYLELLSVSRIIAHNVSKSKKELICEDTKLKIVCVIEKILNSYYDTGDYSLYRNCCQNYMDWLKVLKRQEQIDETLLKIGESYELDAEKEGNTNLAKAEFYQLAAWHYANIGEREKVYYLKIRIKESFKAASDSGEFKTISTTQSIPVENLQEEAKDFIKGTVEETFKIVSHSSDFILNCERIKSKATEQAKNPIYKFVDFGRIQGNRKVFTTKNDDDLLKNLLFQNYELELEITFSTVMNYIWNKMMEQGLTSEIVTERMCSSEYMDEEQKEIISVGIDRMFANDYVSALHILVPQFESYFRTFFEWGGFPTTSLKNNGLQYEKNFNDFIREDFVEATLDKDLLFMIDFVMVEQLGKNLRNNIAHGLSDMKTFNKNNCLIVLYLFWMLTAIKWRFSESTEEA